MRFVLHDELQKIKGIERTETFISLEESINRNVVVDAISLHVIAFAILFTGLSLTSDDSFIVVLLSDIRWLIYIY